MRTPLAKPCHFPRRPLVLRYSLELGCSRSRETSEPSRNPASHEASYDVCTPKSSCNTALGSVLSDPLIEAKGIVRRTANGDPLLDDVSLQLHSGDRLAILGPAGCGKTLLLRALTWLDPLDAGQVCWRGEAISGNAVPLTRSQAIYLHQEPALPEGTVEGCLKLPFALKLHADKSFDEEQVVKMLDLAHRTAKFLQQSTADLSGGEKQIVSFVRAIQLKPTVLLLDEPTAALDQVATQAIEQLVANWLADDSQRAYLWVTHDQQQASRIADRCIAMKAGKISSDSSQSLT